jgi:hypothetical protein
MAIYSFDVFDTLLVRPVLRPSDLFYTVGVWLADQARGGFTPARYRIARQRAEQVARAAARPREECAFSQIFLHFGELQYWGLAPSLVMATELAVERSEARAIAANGERVRALLSACERVVFLSDMYLPRDMICELLNRHVAPCLPEQVFVSGDIGVAKHSGRLYSHVLEKFGISPEEMHHVGDHENADFRVPRRLGVAAELYRESAPTRHERLRTPRRRAPLWQSAASGISRAARLETKEDSLEATAISTIACDVIGPILVAFVTWVLDDARARGIERLYFVSRDGQILLKIAEALRSEHDPECRYLYGSRRAWSLPSVTSIEQGTLSWAWTSGLSRTVEDILKRFEIAPAVTRTLLARWAEAGGVTERPLDDGELEGLCSFLASPAFKDSILERARRRRDVLTEYLAQEGVLDEGPWALVDVGWALRCQQALRRVLAEAGFGGEVRGYYVGVSRDHVPLEECGPCEAFVAQRGAKVAAQFRADWLLKRATIMVVEHLFAVADHPSVLDYRRSSGGIEPVFGSLVEEPITEALRRTVHAAVLRYVSELRASPLLDASSAAFRSRALNAMRSVCMCPTPQEAAALAAIPINVDHSHALRHRQVLASPLSASDLLRIARMTLVNQQRLPSKTQTNWLPASAAISSLPVRLLYRLWYRGQRVISGGAL